MRLTGSSTDQISETLARCFASGTKVDSVDLSELNQLLEYHPEDMTVTAQTGITLAALQQELRKHGQWLPIDPAKAESVTVADVINRNLSGPRRYGYGTIREHLIGLKAVLADGRVIQNGGKVVKNVAGFDLCKLFVGSRGTLGVVVEATFKLRPLPAHEMFLAQAFSTIEAAVAGVQQVLESELTPVVLDLHADRLPECSCVIGLAGTAEEVEWQREKARALGFSVNTTLDYEVEFWNAESPWHWASVLPSEIGREIALRKPASFIARAGNGTIFYRGGSSPQRPAVPEALNRRVKEIFDPKNILPGSLNR